ncbi:MAG: methyltransferase domain-containing protein [Gammaproteobacteria bacterium]
MSSSGKSLQADSKESTYLPHTRPSWVNDAIVLAYKEASRSPDNYYFLGNENYEFREHGFLLETNGVVPAYQQRHTSQIEINIGDIGSGGNQLANALNKKKGIRALGISAADYRRPEQHGIKDATYLLTNAEKVSEIKKFQERDIIFSRYTFMHLADPAGSLCSAYSALKPGGILIIDIMSFYPSRDIKSYAGLSFKGWHRDLIAYLRSEGYEVAAIQHAAGNNDPISYALDGYGLFAIVKTKDELNLPLKYTPTRLLIPEGLEYGVSYIGGVSYSPSDDLIHFREKKRSEEKEEDMKAIDSDLRDLLAKPEYLRMTPLEQAKAIKNIVKRMSSRQREDNLNQLDGHKEAAAIYNDIILKQTPHKLAICEQSHWNMDPEIALLQIKALAAFELVIEEERQDFDALLVKRLGISLKEAPVQNGRWRIAPILPTPFISVANEMELFKFIYKTERKAESGFFKSDFLKDKEELNPLELKHEVATHCKQHPNGRAAQVWQLTQRLAANKPTLAELNAAIESLALGQSGTSLFRKISPAARHEIVNADCRVEGARFCKG